MADLTPTDYAFLIILRIVGREIDNTEMFERFGVRLIRPNYQALNGAGHVESDTTGRPYKHTITKSGRKVLTDKLIVADADDKKNKRTLKEQQLWAALAALHEHHRNSPPPAEPVVAEPIVEEPVTDERPLETRIRAAYTELSGGSGTWVDLAEIRPLFTDVSKAELDTALKQLLKAPDVRLEPEPNRHRIGPEQEKASVRIGGEDRHKLAIGMR